MTPRKEILHPSCAAPSSQRKVNKVALKKRAHLDRSHGIDCYTFIPCPLLWYCYGLTGVRNSMLRSAQPDLVDPVRCLTRLDTDGVIAAMLQFYGGWIIGITCPPIDTGRMNIQPISQTNTSGAAADLIINLQPDRIRITVIHIAFSSQPDHIPARRCRKAHFKIDPGVRFRPLIRP